MSDADIIKGMVGGVTKKWTKQRKAEERSYSARVRRSTMFSATRYTIKDAAYEYMERAYNKVSSNGRLPAHARQVMYAARGYIQDRTGKDLGDQYFIQTLLVGYMQEYGLVGKWNIVFDARGHLNEPHTKKVVPLGTLEVRDYLAKTRLADADFDELGIDLEDNLISTCGPERRYSAILFIEKEGFMPLFDEVKLAKRYDIAIMSTKGMSVVASREAVDRLCGNYNIPLLILRDFDKAGFSIARTISRSTDRYTFTNNIEVHDLGLRLDDVHKYDLPSESVSYGKTCPRRNLRKNGATDEEIEFLMDSRVELNAFTSEQLIEWIEGKLDEHGVKKVVPDDKAISDAYKRALILCDVRKAVEEATENAMEDHEKFTLPDDFTERVNTYLKDYPTESWDQAVAQIAYEEAG